MLQLDPNNIPTLLDGFGFIKTLIIPSFVSGFVLGAAIVYIWVISPRGRIWLFKSIAFGVAAFLVYGGVRYFMATSGKNKTAMNPLHAIDNAQQAVRDLESRQKDQHKVIEHILTNSK